MINFKDYVKQYVNEAVKSGDSQKVAGLIKSYLSKHLGDVKLYPSVEKYKTAEGIITTISYIQTNYTMLRFNWVGNSINQDELDSVTIIGSDQTRRKITFDKKVSLAQTLPFIVDVIKNKKSGELEFYLGESEENVEFTISESIENPLETVKGIISSHKEGEKIPVSSLKLSSIAYKILRQLIQDNPNNFEKYTIVRKAGLKWTGAESILLNSRVSAKVLKDTSKEQWVAPKELSGMQDEIEEQISYLEKVEDLSNMIKFMVKGATNAVFVAGRGGTGKTQTVEDTLQQMGMTDGEGYFKITGSASPAAVYETLYKNRKGVVLFDDCDGALDSQDGRNLIKAATDTKHVRKVAWMKKGGNYYDPQYEEEPEDGGDPGDQLPRHFEFTGKIIFISNLGMHKLDPDGALKTRGMMIEMNPTNMEMIDFMEIIYEKVAILEPGNMIPKDKRRGVLDALKPIIAKKAEYSVNLRLLVKAMNLAATGLAGWERMLKYS